MRIKITDIGREYGLNPDQMYAFALEYGGYALQGTNVDDATISYLMKSSLAHDFKRANRKANKKRDWRDNFVSESLEEFLRDRI